MEASVNEISPEKVAPVSMPAAQDSGKVRMGTLSPSFPPVRARPVNLADSGRLRMGTLSPTFPPVRSR